MCDGKPGPTRAKPVYFVWDEMPHTAKGTAKAVGSHFCSSGTFPLEDCAKSEIRVGWGPAIADLDKADCAVILSYRGASPLSPFVSFILKSSRSMGMRRGIVLH